MMIGSLGNQTSTVLNFGRPRSDRAPSVFDDYSAVGDIAWVLAQALDALDDGLIITDIRATVIHANQAARAIFASGGLMLRNNVLHAATADATHALRDAIARHAEEAGPSCLNLARPGARQCMRVTVARAIEHAMLRRQHEPSVIVIVKSAIRAAFPSDRMLQATFDLTSAEARLACEVVKGDGLLATAKRLGISANTARTHLNRVFGKTGTKRQAELVRLLLSHS
jgi:DNA-binding CsgD family transcriptional regulator